MLPGVFLAAAGPLISGVNESEEVESSMSGGSLGLLVSV